MSLIQRLHTVIHSELEQRTDYLSVSNFGNIDNFDNWVYRRAPRFYPLHRHSGSPELLAALLFTLLDTNKTNKFNKFIE